MMKLHVVHDESGEIVAASVIEESGEHPTPVAGAGQVAVEVEVPGEFAGEDLATICRQLRIEPGEPRLTRRDGASG
jgi:hypothetical protein